ncbi:MAG: anti-sigma factor domain-containing protein [Thermoanaerobacteraceae bacterium]|nr:anti-sigma factor domain-containing protein [Thermoanaerobacteraceae bacterium]
MAGAERGVVLEVRGRKAIVLTPEGEFRRVRLAVPLPEVGEEIMLPPNASRGIPWYRVVVAAAALLFIALAVPWTGNLFGGPREVAYYISVDINPSIELAADRRERVMEARAFNPEGEDLLEGLRLEKVEVQRAVAELAREAVRRGYYRAQEEGVLLLAVVPATDAEEGLEAGESLAARLTTTAEKALEENRIIPVVQAATMKPALREQALRAGLSSGKYAVLLESLAQGVDVSGESLKQERILDVLRKSGADWQEILRSLGGRNNLEEKERRVKPLLEKALGSKVDYDPEAAGRAEGGREEVGDGLRGNLVKSSPGTPARTDGAEMGNDAPKGGKRENWVWEAEDSRPAEAGNTAEDKERPVEETGRKKAPRGGEGGKGRGSPPPREKEPRGWPGKNERPAR